MTQDPPPALPPTIPATDDAFHGTVAGVQVAITRWVCVLGFTDIVPIGDGAQERVVAHVNVPWVIAKALVGVLGSAIEEYQRANGDILLPKMPAEEPVTK